MTKKSRWIAIGTTIVALLAAFYVWHSFDLTGADSKGEKAAASPKEADVLRYPAGASQLASVKTQIVEFVPLPLAEPLNARVTYDDNVTARVSSPIAGRVTALRLQPGDSVRAGDTLLQLDAPDLGAAVSDVDKAVADMSRKKIGLDRARLLLEAGVLARKDLENADADYEQARAEAERARQRLRNLAPGGATGGSYSLRAPLGGVIADRHVSPGLEVRPDLADPLFVITDTTHLWVLADLREIDLEKVALGHSALVEVDAFPGRRFPGVVERIAETVDPSTRRIQVRVAVANPERKLKPEMYARVTLIADENRKSVRVPNSALVTQGVYSYVFVETEPGVFMRRRAELSVQDREYCYIASGVNAGEKVVVSGALLLNAELLGGN